MMKIGFAVLLALAASPAAAAEAAGVLNPEFRVVLSAQDAHRVEVGCTQQGPPGMTGTWTLTPSQADRVDALLAPLLTAHLKAINDPSNIKMRGPASDYYRQFYGLRLNGRQVIYVNGFSRRLIEDEVLPDGSNIGPIFEGDWRRQTVAACDGGLWYFQVVYDVATDALSDFKFNRTYAGPVR
jgi:hypothetical protein